MEEKPINKYTFKGYVEKLSKIRIWKCDLQNIEVVQMVLGDKTAGMESFTSDLTL